MRKNWDISWRSWCAAAVVALGFSGLFVGWFGVITCAVGLCLLYFVGPRWVAATAIVALVIAAIATAAVSTAPDARSAANFAAERPLAADAAAIAGVSAMVAVVGFSLEERARRADAQADRSNDGAATL